MPERTLFHYDSLKENIELKQNSVKDVGNPHLIDMEFVSRVIS